MVCSEMYAVLNTKKPKGYYLCKCGMSAYKGRKPRNTQVFCSRCEKKGGEVNSFLKSAVIDKLQYEGYNISFEQLRKYEVFGLVYPYRKPGNKYRVYNSETLEKIRWIYRLRLIGFSLPRIKEFLELKKDQIEYRLMCSEIKEKVEKVMHIMKHTIERIK